MTLHISGRKFGSLLVSTEVESRLVRGRKRRFYLCQCDCGQEIWAQPSNLIYGKPTSCGRCCKIKHGLSKTSTYRTWANMLSRCRNPNGTGYHLYGGKGVKVCSEWDKFENFYRDMGDRPSLKHSIDRIDSNGNYELANCRWATAKEQAVNRKTTRLSFQLAEEMRALHGNGKTKYAIAKMFGVSFSAVARVIDGSRWM